MNYFVIFFYICMIELVNKERIIMSNIRELIADTIKESIEVKTIVLDQCIESIERTANILIEAIRTGGKIMFCGNGGSAADAQHLAAELVIRYRGSVNRKAIASMALTVDPSIMTAGGNDIGYDNIFAREVEAYGKEHDVLVGITTSGNSPNILKAVMQAKEMGIKTIGLLGGNGGTIINECDDSVLIPSKVTARIQESHIMTGHIWCDLIERALFPEMFNDKY